VVAGHVHDLLVRGLLDGFSFLKSPIIEPMAFSCEPKCLRIVARSASSFCSCLTLELEAISVKSLRVVSVVLGLVVALTLSVTTLFTLCVSGIGFVIGYLGWGRRRISATEIGSAARV